MLYEIDNVLNYNDSTICHNPYHGLVTKAKACKGAGQKLNCCNPSLGLATKARACKGVGQKGNRECGRV